MYIYIYIKREREREIDRYTQNACVPAPGVRLRGDGADSERRRQLVEQAPSSVGRFGVRLANYLPFVDRFDTC